MSHTKRSLPDPELHDPFDFLDKEDEEYFMEKAKEDFALFTEYELEIAA